MNSWVSAVFRGTDLVSRGPVLGVPAAIQARGDVVCAKVAWMRCGQPTGSRCPGVWQGAGHRAALFPEVRTRKRRVTSHLYT